MPFIRLSILFLHYFKSKLITNSVCSYHRLWVFSSFDLFLQQVNSGLLSHNFLSFFLFFMLSYKFQGKECTVTNVYPSWMSFHTVFGLENGHLCHCLPYHDGTTSSLSLLRPCACCQSLCVHMCINSVVWVILFSWHHPRPLALTIFPPPLPHSSQSSERRSLMKKFHLGPNFSKPLTLWPLPTCEFLY